MAASQPVSSQGLVGPSNCTTPVESNQSLATTAHKHTPSQGTLDAVLCRETGLHLAQDAAAGWRTVYNNLKAPGTFILLTHGPPSLRRPLLDQLQWSSITVKAVVPQTTPTAASQAGKPGKSAPAVDALQLVDAALEDAAAAYVYVCKKPYS